MESQMPFDVYFLERIVVAFSIVGVCWAIALWCTLALCTVGKNVDQRDVA